MSYRFHASAPPGEWINDPNALFFAGGRYHLFLQHAADAPDFRRIGWGHLSSPDLTDWRWEGVTLPPDDLASAYSGSLVMADPPELFFTRHERAGPWQSQRRARLSPHLAGATPLPGEVGPAGRNVRDPFVWRAGGGWRMLLARPCDWTAWRDDPPSTLELWGSDDRERWSPLATIGPWMPPGVMWEVPALIDLGERHALLLSLVDRRADTAECEVRYWLGRMSDAGFAIAAGFPADGVPLDFGPDFYAAIPNTADGWPDAGRAIVAWASSWNTARRIAWPERRGGGPITMARDVALSGDRLRIVPGVERAPDRVLMLPAGGRIGVTRGRSTLEVTTTREVITVRRESPGLPPFARTRRHHVGGPAPAIIFVDGDLLEIFRAGISITAVLPGDAATDIRIVGG